MAIESFLFRDDKEMNRKVYFHYDHNTGDETYETVQDVTDLTEANKAHFNSTDERARWKHTYNYAAEIPMVLYYKMRAEGKTDDQAYMKKWLNDADNRAFRVRPGRV